MAMVGSAGPREGNYEAHSERRFIEPAGTLFVGTRLFFFVFGDRAAETSPVPACQSVARLKSNYRRAFINFYFATRLWLSHTWQFGF